MKLWQKILKRALYLLLVGLGAVLICVLFLVGHVLSWLSVILYPIVWLFVGRSVKETKWLTYLYVYDVPTEWIATKFTKNFGDV